MGVYVTTTDRAQLWPAALAVLAVLALFVALLVILPLAALTMLIGLSLSGMALLVQRASAFRAGVRTSRAAQAGEPGPLLQIVDAEGETLNARAVPLAGPSQHTLALTRDGYVLLDGEGKLLHRL